MHKNKTLSLDQQALITKAMDLNAKAYKLRYKNSELGQKKITQALSLLRDIPVNSDETKRALAECLLTEAGLHYGRSEFEEGVTSLHEALEYFEILDDAYGMARVYNIYGVIYQPLGDFAQALDYYLRALTLLENTPKTDYFYIAVIGNLGLSYLEMSEYEEAEYYLLESLKYAQNIHDNTIAGDVYDNLCKLFTWQKDYVRALKYGEKGLAAFTESGHIRGQADIYNSLGHIYMAQDNPEKALKLHRDALALTQQLSHRYEEIESQRFIALSLCALSRFDEALDAIEKGLTLANSLEVRQLIYRCHRAFSKIHKSIGNFESALKHHEQFFTIKESVFSQNADRRVRTMALMQQLRDAKEQTGLLQQKNEALEKEIAERKRLQTKLEYIATIDPLTELLNRRAFFTKTAALLDGENKGIRSILILDIDNFKHINDIHGHLAGDLALRTIGTRIRNVGKDECLPCRFGGDEFAILLPDTTPEKATAFANRLITEILETPISFKGTDIYLKASVGVASLAQSEFEIDYLLDLADQALYQAKASGKNQVRVFET